MKVQIICVWVCVMFSLNIDSVKTSRKFPQRSYYSLFKVKSASAHALDCPRSLIRTTFACRKMLPDADVLPSNPSRWRDLSVESRAGWALVCCSRHSHPPFPKAGCSYHDTDRRPDRARSFSAPPRHDPSRFCPRPPSLERHGGKAS